MDDAKPDLPGEADEPKVTEVSLSLFPILTAALYGPVSERDMVLAARDIKDKLEALEGVLEVTIGGDREEVLEILLDASAIEAYGLDPSAVIRLVSGNNQLVTAGAIDDGGGRLLVKVPGLSRPSRILSRCLFRRATAPPSPLAISPSCGGLPSGRGLVTRQWRAGRGAGRSQAGRIEHHQGCGIGATVIDTEARKIGEGVKVSYLFDDSKDVRNLLSDLGNNVAAAVIIVMVVVLAILGIRNATLVGLAIPGSFFVGISILNMMGVTMNIIVLFSLILVAGMLVDGVIVTTEYADRRIDPMGSTRREAYRIGAQRMAWPIISSTITTLMVFMPLLVWPGIVGQFMKYLPITVICVLTASLFMALIFIPVLGGMIGKKSVPHGAISATARAVIAGC